MKVQHTLIRLAAIAAGALAVVPATASAGIWTPVASGTTGDITAVNEPNASTLVYGTAAGLIFKNGAAQGHRGRQRDQRHRLQPLRSARAGRRQQRQAADQHQRRRDVGGQDPHQHHLPAVAHLLRGRSLHPHRRSGRQLQRGLVGQRHRRLRHPRRPRRGPQDHRRRHHLDRRQPPGRRLLPHRYRRRSADRRQGPAGHRPGLVPSRRLRHALHLLQRPDLLDDRPDDRQRRQLLRQPPAARAGLRQPQPRVRRRPLQRQPAVRLHLGRRVALGAQPELLRRQRRRAERPQRRRHRRRLRGGGRQRRRHPRRHRRPQRLLPAC